MEQLNCTARSICSSWALTSTRSTSRVGWGDICARARPDRRSASNAIATIACLVAERGIGHSVVGPPDPLGDGCPGRIAVHVAGAGAVGKLARAVQLPFHGLRVSVCLE